MNEDCPDCRDMLERKQTKEHIIIYLIDQFRRLQSKGVELPEEIITMIEAVSDESYAHYLFTQGFLRGERWATRAVSGKSMKYGRLEYMFTEFDQVRLGFDPDGHISWDTFSPLPVGESVRG